MVRLDMYSDDDAPAASAGISTAQRRANARARADITDDERAKIAALVNEHGMRGACDLLQLDEKTVLRVLPPLPVHKQTELWIRTQLERLDVRA